MKYADEYRDPATARRLIAEIHARATRPMRIMEFCGGHTHAIMRYGLRQALGPFVQMASGPGCPVCVTADEDIDYAIALAQLPGVTVATFGDMVRVPGTRTSLQEARARGADVRIVYSALDAVEMAHAQPGRSVVMLGIGFETTAPGVAASLVQAREQGLANYYVYSLHKLTPPATHAILDSGETRVDAILGPGHVTAILGWRAWEFLPREYGIPCAISGFELLDMIHAIGLLVEAVETGAPNVANAYGRGVTAEGNRTAQALLARVFEIAPASWRGIGVIPQSGLSLRADFAAHDARFLRQEEVALALRAAGVESPTSRQACRCGEVLRGVLEPPECPLFGRACTPARPFGPCMVSNEGACAAHYRYGGASF